MHTTMVEEIEDEVLDTEEPSGEEIEGDDTEEVAEDAGTEAAV